ncbi:MAG TPA: cystathionine gamma-synthase [Gemmatimonadaceae bacterium]|nr:cystathionine gamma-synthase [Gemmatimonadaceae bacterium]
MSQHFTTSVTRAVRAGIASDREHGAVVPPLHLSSTFAFEGFGRPRAYDYTRSGNPTRTHLAEALADLEGGERGVITCTGMSAVTLALQLVSPGDLVIAAHDCYGGTQRLLRGLAKRGHFDVRFVDLTRPDAPAIIAAASPRPRLVWIETPSNPLLRITDIRAVTQAARTAGAVSVVDNTFLSPALQQPLSLGADLVVHSTTKYLNGHSDVVGGAVIARDRALGDELAWWANCLGVTGAPFDSFLTLRGIRTLHLRMRQHLASTDAVLAALAHPAVRRVYYPGLTDHAGHEIARAQQTAFGAMVSFELAGGVAAVETFVSQLKCFTLAESLGGVESLVAHPATMTHASMDADARRAAGIDDSLVRLSVGIEHPDDLARDIAQALAAVSAGAAPKISVGRSRAPADVILLGAGSIGRELAAQVSQHGRAGLRICGMIDRSGYVFDRAGFADDRLTSLCARKAGGQAIGTAPGGTTACARVALDDIMRDGLARPILVDATPADTTDILLSALTRGADVVLANKVPLAAPQSVVDGLFAAARRSGRRILSEATVGAGLPVLDTLNKLIEAGDEVLAIEGCPSGTLGYLFGEIGRGERFSDALAKAMEKRYTESDPRVDLSGTDVARKALILARAIGFRGELDDVAVESLVPAHLAALPLDGFLSRVQELDREWATRANDARRKGRVLRYRAHVTPTSIAVGLVPVRLTEPLGTLNGTDNQFTFITNRYRQQPLVITGPGAGPAVTAAGVLNDLLRLERWG